MTWSEIKVTDWAQLTNFFENLGIGRRKDPSWQFRGQANISWGLKPSILRLFEPSNISRELAHGIEQGVFRRFRSQARIHFGECLSLPENGPSPVWWMLMQHHFCPTRLLDWSESPYVATYYAIEQAPEHDGVVWVLPGHPLNTKVDGIFGDKSEVFASCMFFRENSHAIVYPILGVEHNRRSLAQQGVYTISNDIFADHASIIENLLGSTGWKNKLIRIIIPATLKHDFLLRLRGMNITASSLFPGPDGVGRMASEYIRIRVWDSPDSQA